MSNEEILRRRLANDAIIRNHFERMNRRAPAADPVVRKPENPILSKAKAGG